MNPTFDILGLGCVAIDELLYVDGYPHADTKVQVRRSERQCGGLTATALVAAARLGSKCAYAGTLGEDELSQFVVERLAQEGIDVASAKRIAGARPIHSVVVIDEKTRTRTIFFDLQDVLGAQADWPGADMIRSARVLFIDHFGVEGMIRAAQIARAAGIPVVADFESDLMADFPKLLELVDHLILSHEFATKLTAATDPREAALNLWSKDRAAVIVTCGPEGCWYVSAESPAHAAHFPAFAVQAVDTTGCGDVFHGAYASALARNMDLPDRLRFATAAAALKATQRGGQAGVPRRAAVEAFLKEHAS
ncbi:MAG TPA: PfkB family carbohydrate kinase [Gemmataceae bacterium]|jgi:sugar/nucleoside kinase (ribokinase family)|nr:PfkB family carbohydrate kinase [Gemmataceae bacterium]